MAHLLADGTLMASIFEDDTDGVDLAQAPVRPEIKKPPLFAVVLINDDYTPMDFVVSVLMRYFAMSEAQAVQITFAIHHQGRGVCGVFTKEVAETKMAQVNQEAQGQGHPLRAVMEEA